MKNNASFLYGLFLIASDTVALVLAFGAAYVTRVTYGAKPISQQVPAKTYLYILATLVPVWIIIFALIGLYNRNVYEKRFNEIGRLFVGAGIGTLFVVGYAYFSNEPIFPAKLVPVYGFIFTFILLVLSRSIARAIRRALFAKGWGISNVLIVGNTQAAKELIDWLADPRVSGYKVVGIVGEHKYTGKHIPRFSSFEAASKKLGKNLHGIMQTELFADSSKNNEILSYAQNNHVAYRFVPGNSELFVGNIDVELFQSSIPMVAVHQTALIGWGRIAKRIFDLFVSLVLIIVFSPLLLIIAMVNKPFSGSVFFRQTRLTRFNKKFRVFKFRTQYKKYDGTPEEAFAKMGKPELAQEYRANGDYLTHDPRVTRFGRFLRATSLDELPQLFNILKGDISLVGPRALIPQELDVYEKRHAILSVKSGLTGLAQVSGRRDISFDERRKLDLYYVQNWSFWLDVVILAKTFWAVLSGRGAK
ncbi:sugar transferase [Candidatus Saccharibacteria bacterium]|nr:sugar transferase [Candidatus Saccharibacteria bacterium]